MNEVIADTIIVPTGGTNRQAELLFDAQDANFQTVPQYVNNGLFDDLNEVFTVEIESSDKTVVDVVPISDEPITKFIMATGDSEGETQIKFVITRTIDGERLGTFIQPVKIQDAPVPVGDPVSVSNMRLVLS